MAQALKQQQQKKNKNKNPKKYSNSKLRYKENRPLNLNFQ